MHPPTFFCVYCYLHHACHAYYVLSLSCGFLLAVTNTQNFLFRLLIDCLAPRMMGTTLSHVYTCLCRQLEKKSFKNLFMLSGFNGFDGDFSR